MHNTCRLGIWLLGLMSFAPGFSGAATLPPMIDAHAHYTTADAAALSPADVIAKLDAAGVSRLVVSGSPSGLALQLAKHAPGRIIPLLGVYDRGLGKADWMHDSTLPERVAMQLETGSWAGIGELHLFTKGRNNPVFEQLVKLAESHGLVLMIHGDAEVVEHAFVLAPQVRVLWAHLGTRPEPELLAAMLERYQSRLWIDTSVRDDRIAPEGNLLPAWKKLFLLYPERFLVAVDTFSDNRWQHYETVTRQIRTWVNTLPDDVKNNLLHDNAHRLFQPYLEKEARARGNIPAGN